MEEGAVKEGVMAVRVARHEAAAVVSADHQRRRIDR
jgi:hypothetical protein